MCPLLFEYSLLASSGPNDPIRVSSNDNDLTRVSSNVDDPTRVSSNVMCTRSCLLCLLFMGQLTGCVSLFSRSARSDHCVQRRGIGHIISFHSSSLPCSPCACHWGNYPKGCTSEGALAVRCHLHLMLFSHFPLISISRPCRVPWRNSRRIR